MGIFAICALYLGFFFTGCEQVIEYEIATVTLPNGESFTCEIADNWRTHGIGLSRHGKLDSDKGMLFIYPYDMPMSFWMPPEMAFSLDMVFLDSERRVLHIEHDAPPCKDPTGDDCPSYGPGRRTRGRYVVELVAGTCNRTGLKIGDQLTFILPKDYKFPTGP